MAEAKMILTEAQSVPTAPVEWISLWLGVAIVLSLALAGVWDVWIIYRGQDELTVSYILRSWFARFPPAAVALGVLIGHLVWPGIRYH